MDRFDRRLAAQRKKQQIDPAYQCQYCGQVFVVPILARLHEEKHR
jgi:5-methylcytosine-specific restriction endonuclease McrA